ncbi:putative P protein [Maize associated rhabdovirus]|uniref:Putative P protein n=1 Tax=Maize associated rhabdovirus TaxID=2003308 RepID=A0A1X9Y2V8_9RHAB|nr:putative P protein [Maize associated rhabdovirus]ARS22491.1 putative P protein [Maize associated rhabdovirus]
MDAPKASDIFSQVPDDVEPDYEIDEDEIFAKPGPTQAEPNNQEDALDEEEEEQHSDPPPASGNPPDYRFKTISAMTDFVRKTANDKGITVKKEWMNILTREWHKKNADVYASHIDFFFLGITGERNLSVEKDFKDIAKRMNDDVNRVSGVGKQLKDISDKMSKDLDAKMKLLDAKLEKFNSMMEKNESFLESASKQSSVASWAAEARDEPPKTKKTSPRMKILRFLSGIGFSQVEAQNVIKVGAHHIITEEMMENVFTGLADDELKEEYEQMLCLEGQKLVAEAREKKNKKKDIYDDY